VSLKRSEPEDLELKPMKDFTSGLPKLNTSKTDKPIPKTPRLGFNLKGKFLLTRHT